MIVTRLFLVTALVLAAGGVVSAASAPPPKTGVTEEERDAAKREGQVTYYTARTIITAAVIGKVAPRTLGFKVNVVRLASTVGFNRAVQEFEAGINAADVIDTSVIDHFL